MELDQSVWNRNYKYRKKLIKFLAKKEQVFRNHPLNNGIHMQAHHLISCKAVNNSNMDDLLKSVRG